MAEQDAEYGPKLHDRDPDLCCALRKVEPLAARLEGRAAWVTGMRRVEAPTRADIPVVGWDDKRDMVKVNPLAAWTEDDVEAYQVEHDVLRNPCAAGLRLDRLRARARAGSPGRGPPGRPLGGQGQDRMRDPHMSARADTT